MKRLYFYLVFLTSLTIPAQNAWQQLGDLPIETGVLTSFATDNFGYILTRNNGTPKVFQYDVSNDSWLQKGSFPVDSFENYSSVVLNNEGYVLTGDPSTITVTLWKYDEGNDLWTAATTQTYDSFGFFGFWGALFANHGKIYVKTNSSADNFRSYDPVTDTWDSLADYPTFDLLGQEGFSIGDRSYFLFATEEFGGGFQRDLWEYDFTNDTWIERAPYIGFIEQGFDFPNSIFEIENQIYVGMTYIEGNFHRYNPENDAWETIAACGYFGDYAGGFVIDGLGYVAGGEALDNNSGSNFPVDDVWRLDPENLSVIDANEINLVLFPNPAEDIVTIRGVPTEVNYSIYNLQGQLLVEEVSVNKGIDTSGLLSGMFLVSISSEEKTTVKKLMKR